MTKSEYLNLLRQKLKGLKQSEIEEILRDQEEYILDAAASGRKESEVISSLGDVSEFTKEIKASHQIKMADQSEDLVSKLRHVLRAIFAACLLAPFNLIFVLGPFVALLATLFAVWVLAAIITGLGFLGVPLSFVMSSSGIAFLVFSFFSSLGVIGIGVLALVGSYYLTQFFLVTTVKYLKWNLNYITGENK